MSADSINWTATPRREGCIVDETLMIFTNQDPTVIAASLHTGMVLTDIFRKSGADPANLPMYTGTFPYFIMYG